MQLKYFGTIKLFVVKVFQHWVCQYPRKLDFLRGNQALKVSFSEGSRLYYAAWLITIFRPKFVVGRQHVFLFIGFALQLW